MREWKGSALACIAAAACASFLLIGGCSSGDSPSGPSGTGNLRGRLVTSAPARSAAIVSAARSAAAVGAEIILDGVPTGSFTDAEGEFVLSVPAGTHTISVSLGGVTSAPITVEMPADGTVELEVELQADGSLEVEEDVDHDGDVDSDDDLNHDGDIDDDDDEDDGDDLDDDPDEDSDQDDQSEGEDEQDD